MGELTRRAFLKIAAGGGAVAAAGLGLKNAERLIPYITPPADVRPGEVTFFATTCRECPAGCGMHVWHRDGRATKVEGNPDHPVNRGRLCARGQASVLGVYDPDRLQHVMRRKAAGEAATESTWEDALEQIAEKCRQAGGKITIISDLQTGALAELMEAFLPHPARLFFYEAFNYQALPEAHGALFGRAVIPDYRIGDCDHVVSFGADFLETWVSPVSFARQFGDIRSVGDGGAGTGRAPARFVYVGPRLSMTAANADDFLMVAPGMERYVALAMVKEIVSQGWAKGDVPAVRKVIDPIQLPAISGVDPKRIAAMARRFVHAKASVALAGPTGLVETEARETALAAGLLNYVAGRIGTTVDFSRPHALSNTASGRQMQLLPCVGLGPQDVLFILNTNPVFTAPNLTPLLAKAGTIVYMGTMMDETAEKAHWVLPVDSPLESWGEYSPTPDVHGLMQPAMSRMYDSRNSGDVFLALAECLGKKLTAAEGQPPAEDFQRWFKQSWAARAKADSPSDGKTPSSEDDFWQASLQRGGAWTKAVSSQPASQPAIEAKFPAGEVKFAPPPTTQPAAGAEVQLWAWPHVMLFDGRGSNRRWLQESPEPVTTIAWGSWIDIHTSKAKELGIVPDDVIELVASGPGGEARFTAPVRITDDVDPGTAAIALGQGHTAMGSQCKVGDNGFKLLAILQPAGGDFSYGQDAHATRQGQDAPETHGQDAHATMFGRVRIVKTGRKQGPVYGTTEQDQHGRELLQWVALGGAPAIPEGKMPSARMVETPMPPNAGETPATTAGERFTLPLPEGYDPNKDMYAPRVYTTHRWAMVADLQRCTGCGACAVACYAENNIAVAGPQEMANSRALAWLRIVPYHHPDEPRRLGFLPMMCQHCDAAPCEPVCPVFASVHNEEGLNAQVYNRCIGTRYCSNNCPYKVRRFNWRNYVWQRPLDWQLNPDVTVRQRGVMEKCTFCIQRIRAAQYKAKLENRPLVDGEIVTACQQTCPTGALVFGDLLDGHSRVSRITRGDPRRYHVLEELNTKPAVTYLRRVKLPEDA